MSRRDEGPIGSGRFNLSEWGLTHRSLVLYFLIVCTLIGLFSYTRLGQSEDPPFTFKVMVVRAEWPGASAREIEQQVTDKIEKKLQEIAQADTIRSYSKPGEALVFFVVKDATRSRDIPDIWYQVRKKIGDIAHTFPTGVRGPYFNDEFGDTYGNLFALLGEGVSHAELKRHAEAIRGELLRVKDVAKVGFFAEQPQRVFVEISNTRLATLGVRLDDIVAALARQNAETGAGFFETGDERIWLRPSGQFEDLDAIRATVIRAGGRSLRLGDIAEVRRGYAEPPAERLRYMGQEALGIGVSMRSGGDIVALGRQLDEAMEKIDAQLPAGIRLERVADQPRAVTRAVNEFVKVLAEAVLIVMAVSLLSLGFRTGIVVLVIIPVVLAITFMFMHLFDIGLHKISLGALIIALGLLVDDAIIAVEMMASKMEQGWGRVRAASYAWTSTAMPMLSGTLVTAAGFLPVALAALSRVHTPTEEHLNMADDDRETVNRVVDAPTPEPPPTTLASAAAVDAEAVTATVRADALAYAAQVTELCVLARMPERAAAFIAGNVPLAEVGRALLKARAESDAEEIVGIQPAALRARDHGWGHVIDSRFGKRS